MEFKRKNHIIMGDHNAIKRIEQLITNSGQFDQKDIMRTHISESEKNPRIEFSSINNSKKASRLAQKGGLTCKKVI